MKKGSRVIHPETVTLSPGNVPVVSPIYQSAKFSVPDLESVEAIRWGREEGFLYSRVSNPTIVELEMLLAELQDRDKAIVFGSGAAAITCLYLSLLKQGDHVIVPVQSYAPTREILKSILNKFGVLSSFVDIRDVESWEQEIIPGKTRLFMIESPSNPTTRVVDIEKATDLAHKHGALVCLDNTFAGLHQHGQYAVDIYIHSLTKFAGGHSDVMGGAIIANQDLIKVIKPVAIKYGALLDPHAAFLVSRGMKTYYLRYKQQSSNALAVAEYLESHAAVERVLYPGLSSHPDFDLAREQMEDSGCIISIDLKGGEAALRTFFARLNLFQITGSLGCVESLVAPTTLFYTEDLSDKERELSEIKPGTVRLSIGVEAVEDLIEDLEQALNLK